jgi:hypothetical protein
MVCVVDPKESEKISFLIAGCALLRAGDFSFNLDVLHGSVV